VREQRVVLEHDAYVAPCRRQFVDAAPADHDLARGLLDEARDDPQQRGLAAAAGAQQRHQFAGGDLQRHVVDRERSTVAVHDVVEGEALSGVRVHAFALRNHCANFVSNLSRPDVPAVLQ
jgi:hypothetical protein